MKLRRVFALVPDCHVPGWRYGAVWERHFYRGLEQAGVSVIRPTGVDFSWARPAHNHDAAASAFARLNTSDALRTQILGETDRPDAVLSCCFSHDLDLDLVDRVRAAGILWINFYCDSLHAFDRVAALGARTSLNWFVESQAETNYRALGVPSLCAPYALSPAGLPDATSRSADLPLLFIGTATRERLRAAALIRLAGGDLHVSGSGWAEALAPRPAASLRNRVLHWGARQLLDRRFGNYLDDPAMLHHLQRTSVVLGLNEAPRHQYASSYLKLRDLEFPGMGCCYLAQDHGDLDTVFDVGREVLTFRSPREAARLARELARDPATAREFGRRARERVLQDHTWAARLPAIEAKL